MPELTERVKQEIKELKKLIPRVEKRKSRIVTPSLQSKKRKVWAESERLIRGTITNMQEDIETYFKKGGKAIGGFDTEGFFGVLFLGVGITLHSPTKYQVWGDCVDSPAIYMPDAFGIESRLQKLMKQRTEQLVGHGVESSESRFFDHLKEKFHDSRKIALRLNDTPYFSKDSKPRGTGLSHLDKVLGFYRSACSFWKHTSEIKEVVGKTGERIVVYQTFLAFLNLFDHKPYRVCKICKKPQNVVLYCLEDALSSLNILLKAFNYDPSLLAAQSNGDAKQSKDIPGRTIRAKFNCFKGSHGKLRPLDIVKPKVISYRCDLCGAVVDIPRRAAKPSTRRLENVFDQQTSETLRWIQFITYDEIRHYSGLFEQILTVRSLVDPELFHKYILNRENFSTWKRVHTRIKKSNEQSIRDSNFWKKVIRTLNDKTTIE